MGIRKNWVECMRTRRKKDMASKLWILFLVISLTADVTENFAGAKKLRNGPNKKFKNRPNEMELEICPSGCRCSCDYTVVDCTGLNLTSVPDLLSFPPQMEKLDLSDNRLSQFPVIADQNSPWPKLKSIILNSNLIEHIESNNFEALGFLELLSLVDNRIEFIEIDALAGLSNLKDLNLSHNKLTFLYDGLLSCLVNLVSLDLQYNQWESGNGCEWTKSDCCQTGCCDTEEMECYFESEMTELGFSVAASDASEDHIWTKDGGRIKLWSFLSRKQDGFFQVVDTNEQFELTMSNSDDLKVDAGGTLDSDTNYFRAYQVPVKDDIECRKVEGMTHSVQIILGVPGDQLGKDADIIYMLYHSDSGELVAKPVGWEPDNPNKVPSLTKDISDFDISDFDISDFAFCLFYIEDSSQFWMTNIKELTESGYESHRFLSTNSLGVISEVKVYSTEMDPGSANPALIYTVIFYD